jgi:hypothetical protein
MSALSDLLLRGKIPDPFSRRFSWAKWKEYTSSDLYQSDDARLYDAAKIVRGCVDALLTQLNETFYDRENRWSLIDLLVMFGKLRSTLGSFASITVTVQSKTHRQSDSREEPLTKRTSFWGGIVDSTKL